MDEKLERLRDARQFWREAHAQTDDGIGTRRDALDWLLSAVDELIEYRPGDRPD